MAVATQTQTLEQLCINSIRFLAVDAVEKAKSGHPGLPMGAAPMAFVLWDKFMRYNPKNPKWPNTVGPKPHQLKTPSAENPIS